MENIKQTQLEINKDVEKTSNMSDERGVCEMNYSINELEALMDENNGTLDLRNTKIAQLPNKLTVRGDLILNEYINEFPDELEVEGNLDLRNSKIEIIDAEYLFVRGNVFTGPYTKQIKNINVDGDLDLRASENLNELSADSLVICGKIYLDGNNKNITFLPEGLVCSGLVLSGSYIEYLPDDRIVSGDIDLSHSAIKSLPEEFVAYGNVDLSFTDLSDYPKGMVVMGNMDIRGTRLPARREGVYVLDDTITDDGIIPYESKENEGVPEYHGAEVLNEKH